MDFLLDCIAEIVFEGVIMGAKNKKVPLVLRILLFFGVASVYIVAIVGLIGAGSIALLIEKQIAIGLIMLGLGILIVIKFIYDFVKIMRKRRNIREQNAFIE